MIGWISRKKNYTKFLIVTRTRTGSNLLVNSLRSHPNIKAFGEIFRGGTDDEMKELILNSTEGYFSNQIFKEYDRSIRAVGFKIFYHHPVYDDKGKVWQYIHNMNDLRVIHLKRKNILRSLVSRKIAKQSDIWKESNEIRPSTDKRVKLSIDECLDGFNQTLEWASVTDDNFSNNPILQLTYEELTSDYQTQIQRIQEFLNVKIIKLQPKTVKQNPEPLSELIINHEELTAHFY